jgi:molybdopterin converting factor small subunit
MIIRLRVFGALQDFMGGNRFEVQVVPGAKIGDLFELIQEKWGDVLPIEIWNTETLRFREQVVVMHEGCDVNDYEVPLYDGQEVWLIEAIAGG